MDRPNYKTKPTSRAKWQTRIRAPPGDPDGHLPDGGTLPIRSPNSLDIPNEFAQVADHCGQTPAFLDGFMRVHAVP